MDDGSIKVIKGPMFSDKTTNLIKEMREAKSRYGSHNILALKHSTDTRYDAEKIVSHAATTEKAIAIPDLDIARGIVNYFVNIKVIFIDEGQFFKDLAQFCQQMRDAGKHVVVAGLDKNYLREDFEPIKELSKIANIEEKLYAKCDICKKRAPFTARREKEQVTNKNEKIIIGGADIYYPTCGKCKY